MRYSSYFVHFNTSGLAGDVSDVGDSSTNTVVVVTASTVYAASAVAVANDDDDYKYRYKYLSKGERWTETDTLTRNIQ